MFIFFMGYGLKKSLLNLRTLWLGLGLEGRGLIVSPIFWTGLSCPSPGSLRLYSVVSFSDVDGQLLSASVGPFPLLFDPSKRRQM